MDRPNPSAVLLISAPDQKGLVARITDFIFRHGGNILHSDEHIDADAGLFLMRVEWALEGFALARQEIRKAFEPLASELRLAWDLRFSDEPPRTAIMVSKFDHCLYDILYRHRTGELRADLRVIISNHPDLAPLAGQAGIDFRVFPVKPETKAAQEEAVLQELRSRGVEFIILARYMQILTDNFIRQFPSRIINIHHSFLPAFIGAQPYHQAHRRGVKIIGATAHYASTELDAGPIIEQDIVRVSHRDSVEDLIMKGRDIERVVLARAVRLHLENRVLVYGNKTVVFD
jgi:formyltetrahydrofolate deformylase